MNPIPKRHHILPQHGYFKAFATADSTPENPKVWVHSFGQEPRISTLKDAAVVGHFYTFYDAQGNKDTALESFLGNVEAALAPTVEKIIAQGNDIGCSIQERQNFATFVGMMIVRTPQFRKRIEALLQTSREAFDAHFRGQDATAILRTVTNAPDATLSFGGITQEQVEQFYGNQVVQQNFHVLALWGQCLKHAKVLYEEMQWAFVAPANGFEFVTCDDPVARFDEKLQLHKEGIANPDVTVYFPLSPNVCFYAYRDGLDILRVHGSPTTEATPKEMELFHERMVLSAERDVYSKGENPGIAHLIAGRWKQLQGDAAGA